MEIKKRDNNKFSLLNNYYSKIWKGVCPICLKPKSEWEKNNRYTCSKDCEKIFEDDSLVRDWSRFRLKVFNRDKFTCVKCGFKNYKSFICYNKDIFANHQKMLEYFGGNQETLILFKGRKKRICADHIIPIALGGSEWDLNNMQTLCKKCHIKKTIKDLKAIDKYKKDLKFDG